VVYNQAVGLGKVQEADGSEAGSGGTAVVEHQFEMPLLVNRGRMIHSLQSECSL
jgi:hypothetical protein